MSWLDKRIRSVIPFLGPRKGGYINTVGAGSQEDRNRQGTFEPSILLPQELCDTFYLESASVRKAISLIVEDSAIRWREFEGEPEQVELMAEAEEELEVKEKVIGAWEDARKYGSSFLIIVDDFPLDSVLLPRFGSIKQLLIFTRFDVKSREINMNPESGMFKKVEKYTFYYSNNKEIDVHASRVIQFDGFMPKGVRGWKTYKADLGVSMIVPIVNKVLREESTSAATSRVAAENATPYLKDSALTDSLESGDEERIKSQLRLVNKMKSVWNMLVVNADSEFSRLNFPMSGYASVLDFFEKAVASAAEIPYTRFIGTSPQGFNSGDSELVQYANSVLSEQNNYVRPRLRPLDAAIAIHIGIGSPLKYRFISLLDASPSEEAQVVQRLADAAVKLEAQGLIGVDEARSIFDGNNTLGHIAGKPLPPDATPPNNQEPASDAPSS